MEKNKKIKILLVSPYSRVKVGGIGTWTKIMLDFCKNRDDVELFFQNTATDLPKRAALKNSLLHVLIGSLDSLSILLKLFINLIRYKPNVVHYTSSAGFGLYKDSVAIFIVRKLFRRQIIIHRRFGRIPELGESKNNEWKKLYSCVRKASASIVIDVHSYKTLIKEGLDNVYLTPNPISTNLEAVSKSLDINSISEHRDIGMVLFVGHILKAKGISELIKATKDNPAVTKLIVIGPFFEEDFEQEMHDLASDTKKDSNWIFWAGELEREKVFEYYKRCSVFCLPSYTEGFPNSVIEAMALGCPIVATTVGAIPEMLDGNCGRLVESRNIECLGQKIQEVIEKRPEAIEMGKNAREKVLNQYVIEKVFSMYYSIWCKFLK